MNRNTTMVHYPTPTTYCEVSYDSDWYDDRRLTPYRYSLMRNDDDSNSDTVSLTLPSQSYYEYLKSFYDCRTTASVQRKTNGYPGHLSEHSGRAPTWHAFSRDSHMDYARQNLRSEPSRIRPTYAFPALHIMQGGDSGDENDGEMALLDRSREKLVWVDALNKWVPQHQLQPRPYMSFIGNPPTIEKLLSRSPKETPYYRMSSTDNHLYMAMAWQKPMSAGLVNEKREAVKKRAQEIAEQKKQRKAYSTPLYTPVSDREYKKRTSLAKSMPVSPVQEVERVPSSPRQVWEDESHRTSGHSKTESHPSGSLRREISITLVPKEVPVTLEEPDNVVEVVEPVVKEVKTEQVVEVVKESLDRKLSLVSEVKEDKPKKKKKKESDKETAEERQAKLAAEQRLIESLEKQRQQQAAEQQRLLREQQEKENQRKEQERRAEEERLRQLNERKQPLAPSNHDNTSTAGLVLSQNPPLPAATDTFKANTQMSTKNPEETASKYADKSKSNNLSKISKKATTDRKPKFDKETKQKGHDAAKKTTNENYKDVDKGGKADFDVSAEREKGGGRDETDNQMADGEFNVGVAPTPAQGKRRKGKGDASKTKIKPVKVEKPPKKSKKPEPKEKPVVEEKLPITAPEDLQPKTPAVKEEEEEEKEDPRPKSPHQERRKNIVEQRQIVKKERRESRKCSKKDDVPIQESLPEPEFDPNKKTSWIYDSEDFSETQESTEGASVTAVPLPSITENLTPEFIEKQKQEVKEKKRKTVLASLISAESSGHRWRKPGKLDNTYNDEMRRLELAEARRKKQMEMFEKLKSRRSGMFGDVEDDGSPRFEDYGFLAKYCIFTKGNIEMYRHAFDAVDEEGIGWLEGQDVMIALRGVNNKLTEAEEEYLYRILELTGYNITHGADFKMFSVLAALSQRISALDHWMKNIIGSMDFKTLEMKMFKCKTLWECNVDEDSNRISLDQLCVELRAGGVSLEHELEVRDKLSHLHSLDLLDFLTYVPLFIMIHESVVNNPLDDSRSK